MPREVPSSSQHWEPWGPVHPVPPCVLGTHTRSLSPIRQGSQSSTPISVQHRHARRHHGLDLASMGWCVVGMCHGSEGRGDGRLGTLTQAGGIGDVPWVVAVQGLVLSLSCHPVQ